MATTDYDLVITNATLVDGSGGERRDADIAVRNGLIERVEAKGALRTAKATEVLDATGHLVTPGFVDIHTHYDGQVTWDPNLSPSCWHGVTTVVMGNCGVGFAPVRPSEREWLVELMEGVEDIPGAALKQGMQWGWESFGEYIEFLDRTPRLFDVGTQVPHGPVRAYVMGERGARNEPATSDDIAQMKMIVRDAIAAGALGFSTSRTMLHKALDGEPVPGTFATEAELVGVARALTELGAGVFEVSPSGVAGENDAAFPGELELLRNVAAATGRPVAFNLTQSNTAPDLFRELLGRAADAAREGIRLAPQVAGRASGLLFGLETTYHPFAGRPSYAALNALSRAEKLARLRDPQVRGAILAEPDNPAMPSMLVRFPDRIWRLDDAVDYEPPVETSLGRVAAAMGCSPADLLYDWMTEGDGTQLFNVPMLNYAGNTFDALREMLVHPTSVLGLSDGGAHCAIICDASIPTSMITHWTRDRVRGERLPLEFVVHKQTRQTAELYGLLDRGLVAPGHRGDFNVIDYDALRLHKPETVHDLPGGARRLVQRADGYVATIVAGQVIARDGELTGALPGRMIRGAQSPRG
jgi:N-acyl-D-aspartate/D-glutamate deacylase